MRAAACALCRASIAHRGTPVGWQLAAIASCVYFLVSSKRGAELVPSFIGGLICCSGFVFLKVCARFLTSDWVAYDCLAALARDRVACGRCTSTSCRPRSRPSSATTFRRTLCPSSATPCRSSVRCACSPPTPAPAPAPARAPQPLTRASDAATVALCCGGVSSGGHVFQSMMQSSLESFSNLHVHPQTDPSITSRRLQPR